MQKHIIFMASVATTLAAGLTAAILFPTTIPETNGKEKLIVQEDTCPCFNGGTPDIGCDSIKVMTFQGNFPDCVKATTIYADYPSYSSGRSEYLALGFWKGLERRIFIRFELEGIDRGECRNPNLGFMAPFDSAQIVFYVVRGEPNVNYTGLKNRQFFVATALTGWGVGTNGEPLNPMDVLLHGDPATGSGPTWNSASKNYQWPFDSQPRNIDFAQLFPGQTPIDSIVFVCHRPMPYNSPIKRTLRNWITQEPGWVNEGWVIMPDSTQQKVDTLANSALLLYSPTYQGDPSLRPKLTLWFTKGVDRGDRPQCAKISYIITRSEAAEPKK
jgi:hypothetical protein